MFWQHDLIEIQGSKPIWKRVLWVDPIKSRLVVLDITNPGSWPETMWLSNACKLVASGTWKLTEGFAPSSPPEQNLPATHMAKRDSDWEVIRSMVTERIPDVFEKMLRAKLVQAAAAANDTSKVTVKKYLMRYFHGGMVPNALLPGWSRCGAPGVSRAVAADDPKRGRPTEHGSFPGVNITLEIRRLFCLAVDQNYARERKHNLSSAYHLCIRRYFSKESADPDTGRTEYVPLEPYDKLGLPTLQQFEYWAGKDNDMVGVFKRRMTPRSYEMKKRALLGNSTAETWGPCSRFQIDATVLDVYVRSRGTRKWVIGRPTLYVVIDVFSRLIVGIYVGLEAPSWVAAMMALANAVQPKQAYCKSFGVDVEPHDWPAQHIPAILLGDRGEIAAANIDRILMRFNVMVENAAPYRADWKGIVESRFRLLPAIFKPYIPGYVETDYRQRGARDYRVDALLDVDEVTAIIIRIVLYYNNFHVLAGYPRHPGMTEDEVPSIPIDLFNWGIANLSGTPRPPNAENFRFNLMPTTDATVTAQGIVFEGRYYACEKGVRERWFEKARNRRFRVPISYDKRHADVIYVHDTSDPLGFSLGTLTTASRDKSGKSAWEAYAMAMAEKDMHADRRNAQAMARVATETANARTIATARAELQAAPSASVRSQVATIRPARAAELAQERLADALAFRPAEAAVTVGEGDNIVPLRPAVPADDYARPKRSERLRSGGDDHG